MRTATIGSCIFECLVSRQGAVGERLGSIALMEEVLLRWALKFQKPIPSLTSAFVSLPLSVCLRPRAPLHRSPVITPGA